MRTLVVAPAWVGDAVMAEPLIARLHADAPQGEIVVAAPKATEAIVARLPAVARVLPWPFDHGDLALGPRWQLGVGWRREAFDRAYVLPNSWKSALPVYAARIPRRIGYLGEFRRVLLNDARQLDAIAHPTLVQRYLALGWPVAAGPVPVVPPRLLADPERGAALRTRLVGGEATPVLALCPGAEYGPAKHWPAAHFAELASMYLARGYAVWLLGSPRDAPLAVALRGAIDSRLGGRVVDLVGATSLADAIDLLALADAVVSNDSGLMHVAAALGRPIVGVFGSTSADYTPPLGQRTAIVGLEMPCRPCFARTCRYGHTRCLHDLPAAQVSVSLDRLLAGS